MRNEPAENVERPGVLDPRVVIVSGNAAKVKDGVRHSLPPSC